MSVLYWQHEIRVSLLISLQWLEAISACYPICSLAEQSVNGMLCGDALEIIYLSWLMHRERKK